MPTSIPECLPNLIGFIENSKALWVWLGGAIEGTQAHGAEAKTSDLGPIFAELAGWKGHDVKWRFRLLLR